VQDTGGQRGARILLESGKCKVDQDVRRLRARAEEQHQASVLAVAPLESFVFRPDQAPRGGDAGGDRSGWQPVAEHTRWGGAKPWATFRASFLVPAAWSSGTVQLVLPLGGQCLAYIDGEPWQGLDGNHQSIELPVALRDGSAHHLTIEAYAAGGTTAPRRHDEVCVIGWCGLRHIDSDAEAYAYDLATGAETLAVLAVDHPARAPLLALLLQAERLVDRRRPGSNAFSMSIDAARALLAEGLPRLAQAYPVHHRVLAIGHAHIDTAWLWPLAQTRRKVVRSWSTALRLMERHPDFHILVSQPQQYKWLEQDEPALSRQVEARVREGRWEPAGAMWVEPDVNLTSGESLVRQFLHGQRYLAEHFGHRSTILWLPDAFGYSAALPQIMRGAGVHTFITSKLSWNDTNKMPHDSFRWRGLDGSEVLAYFITAGIDARVEPFVADPDAAQRDISTYNGHMTLLEVASAWWRYRDKILNDTVIYPFGWGDGGGGPTEEMLQRAERLAAYPGIPAVSQGNAEPYFRNLHNRLFEDPRTAVWDGELYLEYHRGTYSSQSGVKNGNRRGEHALHDAEVWAAWATILDARSEAWHAVLTEAWELLLLNQFHDILPGSSVADVYVDQARDHARVLSLAASVREEAQSSLVDDAHGSGDCLTVFSSLPWERSDLSIDASLLGDMLAPHDGDEPSPMQAVVDLNGDARVLIGAVNVPAIGYRTLRLAKPTRSSVDHSRLMCTERRLENSYFLLEFDQAARMTRLYDKRFDREVLAPGGFGNQLQAFEDKPLDFDAWDIDNFYGEKCWEIDKIDDVRVVEQGPLRAALEIRREWDGSTITQRILLHADLPRIDFQTHLEWRHHQVLLKAAFPLALRATTARYECAFGWVERPTHRNTSWDAARFEVAGHRWADLSEDGYGVSLINDSKYGYDCRDSTLRLTLLKSSIDPDPNADIGAHDFAYALIPHGPDWTIGQTVRAAYAFNLSVSARRHAARGNDVEARSLVSTRSPRAVIDTVKPAEDGDGLIVRVFECAGGSDRPELIFDRPIAFAGAVNLLEEPEPRLASPNVNGSSLTFKLTAFAVRSFRIRLV
jgi:alpha-mannosidase